MKTPAILLSVLLAGSASAIERWGLFEVSLVGPASDSPYRDVSCSATFSQGGRRFSVPGFWDGGDTCKIRFSPPTTGEWRYETRSATPELNGRTGAFTVTAPTERNHGPVEVFDTFYLRYCMARLGAFRNVWWSLANEYDFMTEQRPGHRGNKQWEDWDRLFGILQKEDPHQRLRGIHNGSKWYDHTKDWVTHASIQTSDMNRGVKFREQYRKPVVYDECKYEGDVPQGWGNLSAREMVQRFWLGTMSGCYVGHGETYKHPQDILWWAKGGVLRGESPKRIRWLKDFMTRSPAFHELLPMGNDQGRFLLAKPGEFYLLYCADPRSHTVVLAGNRPYKLDLIDPWAMSETPVGTANAGDFTVTATKPDMAYRFTPYQPGEKLRPEATITASVIRALQLFGSRVDGRGAFSRQLILKHAPSNP